MADMNLYAASWAARMRSRSPLTLRASSTSFRRATDAPPGCTLSQSQCRGNRVTSLAITPSRGRPGPRGSIGEAFVCDGFLRRSRSICAPVEFEKMGYGTLRLHSFDEEDVML